ncbi:MAG: histidinol-phosphate transaminase [Thermoflexales bacterium]|nr:histidinol-phosphate transaminase [Thermoflexales bacterium]
MDIDGLITPRVRAMAAYAPITPVAVVARRHGLAPESIIKLDANENPYGPSPRAIEALARPVDAHRYPDPDQTMLRAAVAGFSGWPAERILCGAGADELLQWVGSAFLDPGDALIDLPPTFGMYRWVADITGARHVAVPRRADFGVDVAAVARTVAETPRAKLLIVANPNNPDGGLLSPETLQALAELPIAVVVDEAYIDFAGVPGAASWAMERPNVMVLRTFSKLAGLAGLRAGYGLFHPRVAAQLWKLKQPYTPSSATSAAVIAALGDVGHLTETRDRIIAERERLLAGLRDFGWLTPLPSRANFLLCRVGRAPIGVAAAGRWLRDALERRGIMVRYFDREGLRDCVRISIGTPEDGRAVVDALQAIAREEL